MPRARSCPHGGARHGVRAARALADDHLPRGLACRTDVQTGLCPTRPAGDRALADDPPGHTVAGGREAIAATGASWRDLPPYPPALNPLEPCFSKRTALPKKAAHRSIEALRNDIGTLLGAFPPAEGANYFTAAGYSA